MRKLLTKSVTILAVFALYFTLGCTTTAELEQEETVNIPFSGDWYFTGDSIDWEGIMPIYRVRIENEVIQISSKNFGDEAFVDIYKGSASYNGDMEVTESEKWDWKNNVDIPLLTYNTDMTISINEQWYPDEEQWGDVQWWELEEARMLFEMLETAKGANVILEGDNILSIEKKVILEDGADITIFQLYSSEIQATDERGWK